METDIKNTDVAAIYSEIINKINQFGYIKAHNIKIILGKYPENPYQHLKM
jgi:hypothetical protein